MDGIYMHSHSAQNYSSGHLLHKAYDLAISDNVRG